MIYRFLTILLWPVFFIYTLKISLRDKSSRYFLQRLGFAYPASKNKSIWIHCASVGEVNTYHPLHLKLLTQFPDTHFIITTNTVTGANTVARHDFTRTSHCFLPIESGFAIKRFIKAYKPSQCLIMETEIWPLLYQLCHANNISISIINARLSHRTLSANNWIKSLYKTSLSYVSKILCKSNTELDNFRQLGAEINQLTVAGNLKFTSVDKPLHDKPISLNNRPYCVAASTHNDEEVQLATLWNKLKPEMLLVLVPRHPDRSKKIQKQLNKLKIKYTVRSQQQSLSQNTKIYLADTLGELTQFIQGAECVFIGGSLIKHGGQNILEPCRMGKPTICGPHMFNFKDEVKLLIENQACIQVKNISDLETTLSNYFKNPEVLISTGKKAKLALQKQSTILDTYISEILSLT